MASKAALWRNQRRAIYLKPQSISLTIERDQVLTFLSDGRPFSIFRRGDFYQRGLNNRWLHKGRTQAGLFRKPLEQAQAELLLSELQAELEIFAAEASGPALEWLAKIRHWDLDALNKDALRFEQIYQPISILPPDQYLSLVVQLTSGCSYNRCSFCNFYKDRPFKIKSPAEFSRHLEQVQDFLGETANLRQGIFLADGDALMTPQPRLRQAFELLRQHYPQLPVYSFMDAFRPQAKNLAQWRELADSGLKRVYLGIETGNPELLDWLEKPGSPQLMQTEARKLKQAGLQLGLILMIGVGGQKYLQSHRQDSLDWLQQLGPELDAGDFVFLSEFVPHPEQPYAAKAQQAGIQPLSQTELQAETSLWRQQLKALPARLVPYHLQEFIY